MHIINFEEFANNQQFYIQEAKAGKIFVYPTDTVYGIGGIYLPQVIDKIFSIKKRDGQKLFSIIAPSFDWIMKEHPEANIEELKMYLTTYHGVTYIFNHNEPGVRIIKHPFQNFVEMLGEPFITTSCNIAGEEPAYDVLHIPTDITEQVDYVIDGGTLDGRPSALIDLVENKIIER